jgi:uncharacterized protein YyaL (SSP411 family)
VQSNHLAGERSLYLGMHAENPVDWYPWGKEAFSDDLRENPAAHTFLVLALMDIGKMTR